MRKKNNKTAVTVVIMLMVVFGMLGLGSIFSQPPIPAQVPAVNQPDASAERDATRKLALSCVFDLFTSFHIHPRLQIIINGKNEIIPVNVGITADCMHLIHTHDASGEIHIESTEQRDFTLGDFFAVWGKPFSSAQILDYKAGVNHEVLMTVDGKPSTEYENLILQDGQKIVIEYRKI
jgi:hypothetical protein